MDEPWGYYAKWNKSDRENAMWSHLYVESEKQNKWTKKTKSIDIENKKVVIGGQGMEDGWNKWRGSTGTSFQL